MLFLKRLLKYISMLLEFVFIGLFVIFEELIWDRFVPPLKLLLDRLISENLLVWLSTRGKNETLLIFLSPFLFAKVFGFTSGILLLNGHLILAILFYIMDILVASISFWIFSHSKEKLLSISFFKYFYDLLMEFFDFMQSLKMYKKIKDKIFRFKDKLSEHGGLKKYIKKRYQLYKKLLKESENV